MPGLFDRLQAEIEAREPREPAGGISASDLLSLPPQMAQLLQQLTKLGDASANELALALKMPPDALDPLLADLVTKGYVRVLIDAGSARYRVNYGRRRRRTVPQGLWARLATTTPGTATADPSTPDPSILDASSQGGSPDDVGAGDGPSDAADVR